METEITFILNNEVIQTRINPAIVLSDFIRKSKKLTGTKEVCKEGDCGACAILLGEQTSKGLIYKTINSCLFPIQKVNYKHVVTIEGLNQDELNPIQKLFINEAASQCGFCTPGFIISSTGYLLNTSKLNLKDAINAIAGNICRCTGYNSIKKSIKETLILLDNFNPVNKINYLVSRNILPEYFSHIEKKLSKLEIKNNSILTNSKLVAGGTDLFVQKPEELLKENITLIDEILKPEIYIKNNEIIISGSTTISDLQIFIKQNKINLEFKKLFKLFASLPIRNSATITGNIINASPIADFTIALLAMKAKVHLTNPENKKRIVSLSNLFIDYKKLSIYYDEVISHISFILPSKNSLFNFEKVSKRKHLDIASVNTAINLKFENNYIIEASISAGGVAPIPLLLVEASNFLINKNISNLIVIELINIALQEISPISDIRGSAEYKTLLLSQLLKAHFYQLFPHIITDELFK